MCLLPLIRSSDELICACITLRHLPSSWRPRRPGHRPCIQDWDSLRWWAGMWSIPHWGQIWRVRHRRQNLAGGLWRPQYPSLHSADHSMKPTWTRPLPDTYRVLSVVLFTLQCERCCNTYWQQLKRKTKKGGGVYEHHFFQLVIKETTNPNGAHIGLPIIN